MQLGTDFVLCVVSVISQVFENRTDIVLLEHKHSFQIYKSFQSMNSNMAFCSADDRAAKPDMSLNSSFVSTVEDMGIRVLL